MEKVTITLTGRRPVEVDDDDLKLAVRLTLLPRATRTPQPPAEAQPPQQNHLVVAVQPQFVVTDFWTYDRVGPERYRWSYPFKTMLDAGIVLAMGSDCPVERLSPIELVDRAVSREPRSLQERLTVEETLRAYTWGSAFAGFSDNQGGSIEPGKWADFTVLSDDVFALPSSQLASVRVEGTVVGGFLE